MDLRHVAGFHPGTTASDTANILGSAHVNPEPSTTPVIADPRPRITRTITHLPTRRSEAEI